MINQPSTQGPAFAPVPGINDNLPCFSTDLSTFASDGTSQHPTHMTGADDQHVLYYLTQVFNLSGHGQGVYNISFIGALPHGYAAFSYRSSSGHALIETWGHPSGRPFTNFQSFSKHAMSVMTGSLTRCRCPLCNITRPTQPTSHDTNVAGTSDLESKDSSDTASGTWDSASGTPDIFTPPTT